MEYLNLGLRWLHILSAIAMVGGVFYLRFAVLPTLESLPKKEEAEEIGAALRRNWAKFVMISIALLLVTGLTNMILIPAQNEFIDKAKYGSYGMLVGIKFLLALPVFFLVSVLNGRSNSAARWRENSRLWLNIAVLLSVVIVCLAGYLRFMPRKPKADAPPSITPSDESNPPTGEGGEADEIVDDAQAVAELEKVAKELKRDGAGNIVEVNLRETEIDDAVLDNLLGLPRLRSVLLNKTAVTDKGLATLGKIDTLENLDLRFCATTNDGIAHLAGLSKLRGLKLSTRQAEDTADLDSPTSSVDDQAMATIGQLENLEALALDNLFVTEEGLAELKSLKKLKELYLAGTSIGDEALPLIAKFPELRKLRIAETRISDNALAHLEKLPNLEELDISRCQFISDAGMEHVGKLSKLKRLNVWRINALTDAGVGQLAGLSQMQWLNLDNIFLTDEGLVHLKNMPELTFLHLGSTQVTDRGLAHLEPMKQLEYLNVSRSGVTPEGAAALQTKLPGTEIVQVYENK